MPVEAGVLPLAPPWLSSRQSIHEINLPSLDPRSFREKAGDELHQPALGAQPGMPGKRVQSVPGVEPTCPGKCWVCSHNGHGLGKRNFQKVRLAETWPGIFSLICNKKTEGHIAWCWAEAWGGSSRERSKAKKNLPRTIIRAARGEPNPILLPTTTQVTSEPHGGFQPEARLRHGSCQPPACSPFLPGGTGAAAPAPDPAAEPQAPRRHPASSEEDEDGPSTSPGRHSQPHVNGWVRGRAPCTESLPFSPGSSSNAASGIAPGPAAGSWMKAKSHGPAGFQLKVCMGTGRSDCSNDTTVSAGQNAPGWHHTLGFKGVIQAGKWGRVGGNGIGQRSSHSAPRFSLCFAPRHLNSTRLQPGGACRSKTRAPLPPATVLTPHFSRHSKHKPLGPRSPQR